jgi:hypothetical protein
MGADVLRAIGGVEMVHFQQKLRASLRALLLGLRRKQNGMFRRG